jgi:beta-N-acetylhexosaminidase
VIAALVAISIALSGAAPAEDAPLGDAQLVGQRLVTGFEGRSPPSALVKRIRAGRLAGVILFSHNFGSHSQARRLIERLQSIPRPRGLRSPLLVMIDQEGGLVKRLPGPPSLSAEEMGAAGTSTCRRQGAATGHMLHRTGVNVDLAPVLDVARPGGAIDNEGRAFGVTPGVVSRCGNAFAGALDRAGVAPTAKHFPGLGAARVNTDDAVQRIDLGRAKLRRIDERPYERFVGDGAPDRLVMLSSAVYTAFSDRPASLTRALARRELRRRLGFDGVSITDALETASTAAFGGPVRAGRKAATAGADLLLYTDLATAAEAANALRADLRSAGDQARRRFEDSAARVVRLRRGL